jgi:NDP-sugar pyrophosphorylase family protein
MNKPTVVILAGGIGKRFSPFVTNKTMVTFLGKPIIQHVLESLENSGFHNVIVVANEKNEEWIEKNKTKFSLNIKSMRQPEAKGMGQAILLVKNEILDHPTLVLGIHMISPDFINKFVRMISNVDFLIAAKKFEEYYPGGYLKVEKDRILSVVEKPLEAEKPSDLVKMVFDYFSSPNEFIELIEKADNDRDDQYEKALDIFLKQKEVKWIEYDGYYGKLKTTYDVLTMTELMLENRLKKNISKNVKIAKEAVIIGNVQIEEGVVIGPFAVIRGPAYIGKNVIIGEHTLIRSSIVEENTKIGFGSEIARSYVGPNCKIHHAYLGDSALEGFIEMAYGSCTANLRIDGKEVAPTKRRKLGAIIAKNAFIGINVSLMPGVVIEPSRIIYPGEVIKK